MGDIVYLATKRKKKPQVINAVRGVPVFRGQLYFEDSVNDLNFCHWMTHVFMQLPAKSKKEFDQHCKQFTCFAELIIKDGTPEMKQAMIDMGFLVTNKGDKNEPGK